MKSLRYIIYVSALLAMQVVEAQSSAPKITSQLSADTIKIGDRVVLTIDVEKDVMQHIEFPVFNLGQGGDAESANPSVEVINDFAADTISKDGRREHLRKRYELAIYDEGIYHMGRAQVLYIDKNIVDTLYAEREDKVVVETFQIDTTKTPTIRDLKPQKSLKWHIAEHIGYIGIVLGVLLLLAVALLLLIRYLDRQGKHISDLFKPAPPPPPHIVAIEALEKLRNEKLWQSNKHKMYYSRLSDILRTYIAGRFGVGAMEMTTDEIMSALTHLEIETKQKMSLMDVLRDSDLVKFAKVQPSAETNELTFDKVYYFVESTKPVEQYEEDKATKNREEVEQ